MASIGALHQGEARRESDWRPGCTGTQRGCGGDLLAARCPAQNAQHLPPPRNGRRDGFRVSTNGDGKLPEQSTYRRILSQDHTLSIVAGRQYHTDQQRGDHQHSRNWRSKMARRRRRRRRRRKRFNTGIPGLSFSWKRALGISRLRYRFARKTGIPTTKSGIQRKVGRGCLGFFFPFLR